MDSVRLRYEQTCPDCGSSDFVEDHAQGDLVCTGCGLVAESHVIDEGSEWRSFGGDKEKDAMDPSRVGGPTNHLLSDGGLSTVIGLATKGTGNATLTKALQRAHTRGANPDQSLIKAFGHISRLGDALGLNKNCKDKACEIFKKAWESKGIRGKGTSAVCAAAVFVACRGRFLKAFSKMKAKLLQVGFPRTFREITAVVSDATTKDISRAFKFIVDKCGERTEYVSPADYVRRFCSHLGLRNADMRAAEETAEAAVPKGQAAGSGGADMQLQLWDGRSPLSVAAAVIYAVTSLPKASKRLSAADAAAAAGIAESTVRSTYRDLHGALGRLVPAWWAGPADLARLPQP